VGEADGDGAFVGGGGGDLAAEAALLVDFQGGGADGHARALDGHAGHLDLVAGGDADAVAGRSTWAVTAALSNRTVTVVWREDLPSLASNHHW
jgi:hypothetical protein